MEDKKDNGMQKPDFHTDDAVTTKLQHTSMDSAHDNYPKNSNEDLELDTGPRSTDSFWKSHKDPSALSDLGSTSGPAFGSNYPAGIKVSRKI